MTVHPWLTIPAEDYEGHMADPAVGQLQMLDALSARLLTRLKPASVAFVGCATGNGMQHADPAVTHTVIGVDIHPGYLEVARRRLGAVLPNLVLLQRDIGADDFAMEPVDLIIAALVLEYVPVRRAVANLARCLRPGGRLAAVLQLPAPKGDAVSTTGFSSLKALAPVMELVAPEQLTACCRRRGLELEHHHTIDLAQGKSFFCAVYRKKTAGTAAAGCIANRLVGD